VLFFNGIKKNFISVLKAIFVGYRFLTVLKKNFISVLKAIFVGCRFLTVSKKNFISVLKVCGALPDHQMTFPCHLLHSCSIDGDL